MSLFACQQAGFRRRGTVREKLRQPERAANRGRSEAYLLPVMGDHDTYRDDITVSTGKFYFPQEAGGPSTEVGGRDEGGRQKRERHRQLAVWASKLVFEGPLQEGGTYQELQPAWSWDFLQ